MDLNKNYISLTSTIYNNLKTLKQKITKSMPNINRF